MDKRPLKALFLDVDDTVYSITEFARIARRNAVRAMIKAGLDLSEEEGLRELDEVISEFGSNHDQHFDKLLKRLPPEICARQSPLIIKVAGIVAYHDTKAREFTAFGDAMEVLRILHARGLRLGVITAGMEIKQAEKIYRLGLHEIVEPQFIYITDCIGISKQNPKIYLRACRDVGAAPEECMYVGDNPIYDIDVPSRIGMPTILSRRGGKYKETVGQYEPTHTVDNFYDVLEIIDAQYRIVPLPTMTPGA